MRIFLRKLLAAFRNFINPGYWACLRCNMPYPYTNWHTTHYDGDKHKGGSFPLCEPCWGDLGSKENRRPYYEILVAMRRNCDPDNAGLWRGFNAEHKEEGE